MLIDRIKKQVQAATCRVKPCLLFGVLLITFSAGAQTDPTRPSDHIGGSAATVANKGLTLESILVSGTRRVAVINGAAVQQGDTVGMARIISIGRERVRVVQDGQTLDLSLSHTSIRKEK